MNINNNNKINYLPPEILGNIFTFLQKKQIILKISPICKKFNDIIHNQWFINNLKEVSIKELELANAETVFNLNKKNNINAFEELCFFLTLNDKSKKYQNKINKKNSAKRTRKITQPKFVSYIFSNIFQRSK